MSEQNDTDTFDWQLLGPAWWAETAKQCGASTRQAKFAAARLRGRSATQSAREAGYSAGNDASMRQTGYRLSRSNIIERLLAFAAAEKTGGYDGTVDEVEARRILSTLARGSDPSIRIRACEAINKLNDQDRQRREADHERSPDDVAAELLRTCPEYGAVILADAYFGQTGTLFGLPYLKHLAPILARDFAPAWARYRAAIKSPDHLADFDKLAQAPVVPIEFIIGESTGEPFVR
jgi:hypothetical protein